MKSMWTIALTALVIFPVAARADLITGVLNFTGTANISLGTIGFEDNVFSINGPGGAQEGGFTALAGTTGTIQNLTNPPDATGPLNVVDFMTFDAAPNITITLTFLIPGINGAAGCAAFPAASGQVCTPDQPDQSPFNLQNTSSTSSTASFNILGTEVDSLTGQTVDLTGAFTTPFTNQNFQQLLATIGSGGTITTPFSAQFSTVPEPSTLIELMMGIGLVGVSRWRTVKRRKNTGLA